MIKLFTKSCLILVLGLVAPALCCLAGVMANNQTNELTITGEVRSTDNNSPLPGATIRIKNSTTGVSTNQDGKYSISVKSPNDVLIFSFLGMVTQEVKVGKQTVINVTLATDASNIEDVVVVGYGSQRKESVVGAISTLNVENIKIPNASVSSGLAGQLAGIVAMTRSGEPGKKNATEFYIRGVSSFMGTNAPLVLVDGIERELDLVDTEDIAAFSILKDASASAVYGVRGANGVLLITTKKGIVGKPVVSAQVVVGMTAPTKMPKLANSMQWAELYNEMSGAEIYDQVAMEKYRTGSDPDLYPNVDWMDEVYKKMASNQRVNIGITGGGNVCSYYVSGSFYNEGSIFKNAADIYDYNSSINYSKFNFRANLDFNLSKTTILNVNLANIYEKSFAPGEDVDKIWGNVFSLAPNSIPVQYSDGKLSTPRVAGYNPWNLLVHSGYREQFWNSAQSLLGLNQDLGIITEGLSANVKFSWDAFNTTTQIRSKQPEMFFATGRDGDGNNVYVTKPGSNELSYKRLTSGTMTSYLEASLKYNRVFGEIHRVGALFLYNHKIHNNTQTDDKYISLPYKNQGIAGRVTYSLMDRYFAEVNVGYNGSENFARGHRFGLFPAFAAGWLISNEKWFAPILDYVDMLKIKGSYGKVGNDGIGGGRWIYQSTLTGNNGYQYGETNGQGGPGLIIDRVENLDVSWETATKSNIGIEVSFFRKLRIQADYFHEKREGIFLSRGTIPDMAGVSTIPQTNIGKAMNQGIDFTGEYEQRFNEVYITARANVTYNRNRLLDNDRLDKPYKYQNAVGKPFKGSSHPFGLVAMGLFESQEDIDNSPVQTFGSYRVGDIKYKDINGDGKVNSDDEIAIGYTGLPEIVYGFGATAQWRSWDVNMFFQGVSHVSFWTGGTNMRPFHANIDESAFNEDVYKKIWKSTNTPEQNAAAKYPRISVVQGEGSSNNDRNSTFNMQDGSFLRLKNIELGYTLPKKISTKLLVKSARFYVSGSNLFTFSAFDLWDTESGSRDGGTYPPLKTFLIGVSAKF